MSDSVSTDKSSVTCVVQDGTNAFPLGVSISTKHIRHIPTGSSLLCQQNLGI